MRHVAIKSNFKSKLNKSLPRLPVTYYQPCTASHSMYKCIKGAHLRRTLWLKVDGWRRHMAGFLERVT